MCDDGLLEVLAGDKWLSARQLITRLTPRDDWPREMTRAEQQNHLAGQVARLVDAAGALRIASIMERGTVRYKRMDRLTAADAVLLARAYEETQPALMIKPSPLIEAFIAEWRGRGVTQTTADEGQSDLPCVVVLSRHAAIALVTWAVAQGHETRAVGLADLADLGVTDPADVLASPAVP